VRTPRVAVEQVIEYDGRRYPAKYEKAAEDGN
jgi:hypothetical protein